MSNLASRLKNRIDVYGRTEIENELGETDYIFSKIKSIWAEITPKSAEILDGQGNTTYADISHKVLIRSNAIQNLTNDMYFVYKNQRYDIKYFNPNYKYNDSIEIFTRLVIE